MTTVKENQTGIVKWFNDPKGYGFIVLDGSGENTPESEIFVHYTAIKTDGFKTLAEGQAVTFDLVTPPHPKGMQAANVRKVVTNG